MSHTSVTPLDLSAHMVLIQLWREKSPWYFNKFLTTELYSEKIHQWCHLMCKNIVWVFKCSNTDSLKKTNSLRPRIRTLRAPAGLNGQPHTGPPWTSPASGPGVPFKSSTLGLQPLLKWHHSCTHLHPWFWLLPWSVRALSLLGSPSLSSMPYLLE